MLKVPITEDLHYVLLLSMTAASTGNSGTQQPMGNQSLRLFSKCIKFWSLPPHFAVILPPSISAYFIFTACIPKTYLL